MMTGGMSCGKMFRSTEPQADKKNKTVLTKRDKATTPLPFPSQFIPRLCYITRFQ